MSRPPSTHPPPSRPDTRARRFTRSRGGGGGGGGRCGRHDRRAGSHLQPPTSDLAGATHTTQNASRTTHHAPLASVPPRSDWSRCVDRPARPFLPARHPATRSPELPENRPSHPRSASPISTQVPAQQRIVWLARGGPILALGRVG